MIVTDLDGTLLSSRSEIPEENIRALRRAMDAGAMVTLASGRMLEATLPIARAIGVNAPLSLFNGAMAYDMAQDRVLCGHTIPFETARAALEEIEARGGYAHAFPGRGHFLNARCHWTDYYENKIGVRGTALGKPLSKWLEGEVYKLLCLGESAELDALAAALAPRFADLTFVKSSATHLEIVSKGVDKASGLRDVGAITGVRPEEMLAFGDEMNDLPMLLYAGAGYAMENAAPGVRAAVANIAPRNTECGVARIVNLYLNEGRMGGAQDP